uniref:Uncharacterized protein n=1 Tax=Brassica campestris TaxID=3711 RepID=M4FI19_BRACM
MQKRDDTYQIQAEAAWERTRFSQTIDTRHQQSIDKLPQQSIDINYTTSIDNHSIPKITVSEKDKLDNQYLTRDEVGTFKDPNGFAKAIDGRTLHKTTKELYDIAGGIENRFKQRSCLTNHPSINIDVLMITRQPKFRRRAFDLYGNRKFYWEEKDEYVVYRDDREFARDLDEHSISIHNKDIRRLLERASRDEPAYICLPEHASSFTLTKLVPEIYTKDEINEMFYGYKLANYYMEEMKQDIAEFRMRPTLALTSKVEAIQGDLVESQSYIARRPETSISIDMRINKSIDTNHSASIDSDTNRGRLVAKTTSNTSNTPYHGKEISADTYATLTRHEFNLESLGERLQRTETHNCSNKG